MSWPDGAVIDRRRFLVGAGAVGLAGLAAAAVVEHPWARTDPRAPSAAKTTTDPGVLVLVTLYGGNDGLNTVIPYTDSAYHAGRPNLGYTPEQVMPIGEGLGLNAKLEGLHRLWAAKQLAVVRGVGYPSPSLSHFQSMDIWQTANTDAAGSGWLGRWLDATGTDPMRAISVGTALPPALRGVRSAATAITSTTIRIPGSPSFRAAYAGLQDPGPDRTGLAALVANSGADLLAVQRDLAQLNTAAPSSSPMTPQAAAPGPTAPRPGKATLADQLGLVSSLIHAGAPTKVYQVSLSSFDTHADEKADHERLLTELDQGVSGFFDALKGSSRGAGVVLMTYSEFGRRVAENASGGTDHGTAAPLFVAGAGVKGGFYGEEPSLTDLDDGDVRFNVDFRSVYATMLDRVVGVDPRSILGSTFPILDLV